MLVLYHESIIITLRSESSAEATSEWRLWRFEDFEIK